MAESAAADITRAEGLVGGIASKPASALGQRPGAACAARFEEAIPEYETAIANNRNLVGAFHPLSQCKLFAGSIEETIPLERRGRGPGRRSKGKMAEISRSH